MNIMFDLDEELGLPGSAGTCDLFDGLNHV